MPHKLNFAVVGGDERQVKLCELLAHDGHVVSAFALDKAEMSGGITSGCDTSELRNKYDCVILPVPVKSDAEYLNTPLSAYRYKADDILSLFPTGQIVVAGKVDNALFAKAGRNGIRIYDYLEREDFTVQSSVSTAEGAIEEAMKALDTTLNQKSCLIAGFGHIGKILAHYLDGLGVKITASARKSGDIAWISAYGYNAVRTAEIKEHIADYDIIFNTIPHLIFTEAVLSRAKRNVFICDLASKPGGVDFAAARELGLKTVHALSIPGKYAPMSAAEAMRDTIYNILDEWGD